MMRWCVPGMVLLLALACASKDGDDAVEEPDWITYGADQLFRGVDLPGVGADVAYEALLDAAKLHVGAGALFPDAEGRTLELTRPFAGQPRRVRLYAQVLPAADGSRLEVFSRLEELRKKISGHAQDPWIASDPDRDRRLENFLLQVVREDLLLGPPVQ